MFLETKRDGEAVQKAVGLNDLIAWLQQQNSDECYNWVRYKECLMGQYYAARGREPVCSLQFIGDQLGITSKHVGYIVRNGSDSVQLPFGAALKRALAVRTMSK